MARLGRSDWNCLAVVLTLLLGGSGAALARAEAPRSGGSVVYGEIDEPQELNCVRVNEGSALRICKLVSDSLIDYDKDLKVIPRLAERFETSADGRTLTFHLRRGVRWHDGQPFTASDVLYTVRQIQSPKSGIRNTLPAQFEPLESVVAPDEFTIVARYSHPYPLAIPSWIKAVILPGHLEFAPGAVGPNDRHPIGTGPFKFVRWDPQDKIVLEANPEYFGGRPHLDRLITRFIPDSHTLALSLKTGETDIGALKAPDMVADDSALPYRILRYQVLYVDSIIWNIREPRGLFVDPRVRRAMSLAFDRETYVAKAVNGLAVPAVSTFVPGFWAHDAGLKPLPYDPNGAAALLASAGWRDKDGDGILDTPTGPASFTLTFSPKRQEHESLAALFQSAVRPLGIDVRLEALEWSKFGERIRGHAFEAALKAWGLPLDPDPYDFFHSSQYPSGQNFGGYASPEVDRLLEEGRRTLDTGSRAEIYHRLEGILREEQPYTFIVHPFALLGLNRRLQGVEIGLSGDFLPYPTVIDWWVTPSPARKEP